MALGNGIGIGVAGEGISGSPTGWPELDRAMYGSDYGIINLEYACGRIAAQNGTITEMYPGSGTGRAFFIYSDISLFSYPYPAPPGNWLPNNSFYGTSDGNPNIDQGGSWLYGVTGGSSAYKGMGYVIQNSSGAIDFSNVTSDHYLHIAFKAGGSSSAPNPNFPIGIEIFGNGPNPAQFTIGQTPAFGTFPVFGDFPRTGAWGGVDIPVSYLEGLGAQFTGLKTSGSYFNVLMDTTTINTTFMVDAIFYYLPPS